MQLSFGDFVLDLGTRELCRGGHALRLSPKAFQLLELLALGRPDAFSKDRIHERLWPGSFVVDGNLANLVSELREALGDDARRPAVIRTVPRFGYAFVADARAPAERDTGRGGCTYRLLWGDREIALKNGENLIGRDEASVAWIDDVDVSRRHARIVIDGAGARLEDLGSKNGTFLDGRRLKAGTPLADGGVLRVGGATMVFRAFSRTGPTATAGAPRPGRR
ncbi:MAG TPA: FHA domain-containing protein [Thermoanaerobaculia bacterium]|nr:FHA domain-containing protein [Thermoanaerobaculia bacterium]